MVRADACSVFLAHHTAITPKIGLTGGAKTLLGALVFVLAGFLDGAPRAEALETAADIAAESRAHPRAQEAMDAFYTERGLQTFWMAETGGIRRADLLLDALDGVAAHGLSLDRYGTAELRRRLGAMAFQPPGGFNEAMALDRDMSAAFLLYADDLKSGATNPREIGARIFIRQSRPDPLNLLRGMARAGNLSAALGTLAPVDPRYGALKDGLSRLMRQAEAGGWGEPVRGNGFAVGDTNRAVTTLRRRLIAMGDLAPEPELLDGSFAGASTYDDRVRLAVSVFQDRHGLDADGVAGPATLRALNEPLQRRMAQVVLNMERLRWRSTKELGRRIEVNQPAFRMSVYDETNTPVHEARVVIGKPERRLQTPEFSRKMSYMVLNPRWNVPRSIVVGEFLPSAKADPTFFARQNMVLYHRGKIIDGATDVDWATMTPEEFGEHYGVIQKPGIGNALGNVKFMFPNGHNVYLHDTPTKHFFDRPMRALSHGCVRVERPFALAWLLLSDQTAAPGPMIERILATGEETEVPLDNPIPVHLIYLTSWVDQNGTLHFRDDVYDRDEALARAMHADAGDQPRQTSEL